MKADRRTLAIGVAALVLVALFVSPALGGPLLGGRRSVQHRGLLLNGL